MTARLGIGVPVSAAIYRVSEKHSAKEHDLGREEDPHPQRRRFVLLLDVVELMRERCGMIRQLVAPSPYPWRRSRMPPTSRPAFPRSSRSVEAMASAIPGPW